MINHGTYAGWQTHLRLNIPMCQPCRTANTAYKRRWRKANPEKVREERQRESIRQRALSKLGRKHPDELEELIAAELRATKRQEAS